MKTLMQIALAAGAFLTTCHASALQSFERVSQDEVIVSESTSQGVCEYEIRGKITRENAHTLSYRPMNARAKTRTEFCDDYVSLVERLANTQNGQYEIIKNNLADNQ